MPLKHVLNNILFSKQVVPESMNNTNVFFLISAPRSGSTWTWNALNQHLEIYCAESNFFGSFFEVRINDIERGKKSLRCTTDAYIETLVERSYQKGLKLSQQEFHEKLLSASIATIVNFYLKASRKNLVCEKITPYLETSPSVIKCIRKYFPKSKIIYLHRDGRDVVVSGVFDWVTKNIEGESITAFQRQRFEKYAKGKNIHLDRLFEPREIEDWAGYWRGPLDHIHKYSGLNISYEALKEKQAEELKKVFQYLRVSDDDAMIRKCVENSSFEKMSGGRRPGEEVPTAKVRKGIIGDWKNYFTRKDGELFHELAGEHLFKLGYEKDKNWYKKLPDALNL